MATGVLKVRVGGAWQNVGVASSLVPHHATHEPGGTDALAALDAVILTQGTLPDARLSANVPRLNTLNTFTQNQTIQSTGYPRLSLSEASQPVDQRLFQIAGIGQALNIQSLNDAGTVSPGQIIMQRNGNVSVSGVLTGVGGATIGPITLPTATLITAGGTPRGRVEMTSADSTGLLHNLYYDGTNFLLDDIAKAGWLWLESTASDAILCFRAAPGANPRQLTELMRLDSSGALQIPGALTAGAFIVESTSPSSTWKQTNAAADLKLWQIYTSGGSFILRSLNDAQTVQQGYLSLNNAGALSLSGGVNLPAGQSVNMGGALRFYGDTTLSMMRGGTAGLAWQNAAGTSILTGADNGTITVPYYLVIPVGANKWAP